MRVDPEPYQFYYGLDLPARTMALGFFTQAGEGLVPRHMTAGPETFRKAIAPSRDNFVVWSECLCP